MKEAKSNIYLRLSGQRKVFHYHSCNVPKYKFDVDFKREMYSDNKGNHIL